MWLQGEQISVAIHHNLKSAYEGFSWVQSHILSRWPQQHFVLSGLTSLNPAHTVGIVGSTYIPSTGKG